MNHSIGVTMKFADFAAGGNDHPRTPPGWSSDPAVIAVRR
jgi:hypothetical protein